MIEFVKGDLFAVNAEALVNTVNCVGVMGRGIALQFKRAFPENFKAYAAACQRKEVQPGRMFVFATDTLTNPRFIINFPTKRHWRGKSRMEDVEAGLAALVLEIREREIRSIAIPPLGAGLGGLAWPEVRANIERSLLNLSEVQVTVFEPLRTAPPAQPRRSSKVPAMTTGRAALVGLMDRYLAGLMDTSVSLLEVHKLMYFMQAAGEPLRLRYVAGHYGPYAENLRHVLQAIDGYYVSGYGDAEDAPDKAIEIVPGAVERALPLLQSHAESQARFDRVSRLVEGFESPFGLELLSTVHWIASQGRARTEEEAITETHAWSERKKRFSAEQIRLARRVLMEKDWIPQSGL